MNSLKEKLSPTEKVNQLYEKYKDKFPNTFLHNLLWQIFVNNKIKLTDAAFVPAIKNGYTELGIADKGEKGFRPTAVVFQTHNHDEAEKICEELNKDVFDIDDETASKIIETSY